MSNTFDGLYVACNGTTIVDITSVGGSSSTSKSYRSIVAYNGDTVAHKFTLYLYDGSSSRLVLTTPDILPGNSVDLLEGIGPIAHTGTSKKLQIATDATATTTEPHIIIPAEWTNV